MTENSKATEGPTGGTNTDVSVKPFSLKEIADKERALIGSIYEKLGNISTKIAVITEYESNADTCIKKIAQLNEVLNTKRKELDDLINEAEKLRAELIVFHSINPLRPTETSVIAIEQKISNRLDREVF